MGPERGIVHLNFGTPPPQVHQAVTQTTLSRATTSPPPARAGREAAINVIVLYILVTLRREKQEYFKR